MYIISNAGDETAIEFDASSLPPLKQGWKRDFVIHGVGWVKDGDINTAFGDKVEPLPFHAMKSYPYFGEKKYLDSKEYREYRKEYNTRWVDAKPYLNALK